MSNSIQNFYCKSIESIWDILSQENSAQGEKCWANTKFRAVKSNSLRKIAKNVSVVVSQKSEKWWKNTFDIQVSLIIYQNVYQKLKLYFVIYICISCTFFLQSHCTNNTTSGVAKDPPGSDRTDTICKTSDLLVSRGLPRWVKNRALKWKHLKFVSFISCYNLETKFQQFYVNRKYSKESKVVQETRDKNADRLGNHSWGQM